MPLHVVSGRLPAPFRPSVAGRSGVGCWRSTCNGTIMDDPEIEALRAKLTALKTEHRDLDDVIQRLQEKSPFDQLQLSRLKKRKLVLKDMIARVESQLLPDIIA